MNLPRIPLTPIEQRISREGVIEIALDVLECLIDDFQIDDWHDMMEQAKHIRRSVARRYGMILMISVDDHGEVYFK